MGISSKRIVSPNSVSALKTKMPSANFEAPNREEQCEEENTTRNGGGFNDIIYKIEDTPPWYYAMLLALQVLHLLRFTYNVSYNNSICFIYYVLQ